MPSLKRAIDIAARTRPRSEIARLLGVDRQRLWQWESGLRTCPDRKVAQIAALADIPASTLIGEYRVERALTRLNGKTDPPRRRPPRRKGCPTALRVGRAPAPASLRS